MPKWLTGQSAKFVIVSSILTRSSQISYILLVMSLKEDIVKLQKAGYNYPEIATRLRCSKSTVSYHIGVNVKRKAHARQRKKIRENKIDLKTYYGGKCIICGYSRCTRALEFHHIDDSRKINEVAALASGKKTLWEEAKKCVLLCVNCHREEQAGLIQITEFRI